ncbi:ribosomal oxygenase 1-like [Oncorhynchus tshawytscha]|uniref:Bifunctional lysine-specific demethylase and histidyl-hydroxylase n=1 Tax=Oncorhynchus tshawytscha TaxID=74940 RepID=A0A8C8CIA4_ONCTS|nr:ribosomal oxygenase 1-like [Oncorhynchus tshawytscha]
MEKKHVSAFELYQNALLASTPEVKTSSVKITAKKQKENGIQTPKSIKKTKRKQMGKQVIKAAQREETVERLAEEVQCGEISGVALDSLLGDLAKVSNSRVRASKLFQWLIHPIPSKSFFRDAWEKKPVLIKRQNPDYYTGLFSTAEFDRILRRDDVQYGVNLDVTSYRNGKRETHNPPGRALPFTVWDFYESGCSLRMLNPQAFSSTVWNVLSILQEHFGSMAGANMYLTPPGTQGFAPHYDDIEAFVVQLEGKKHWRVYNPRSENEVLPVVSSPNFSHSEIGKPIMEAVLEAGDLLYFPRGFIHQGDCLSDAHSLHITVSSYQRNSWGNLLAKVVPAALEMAMEEDVDFRGGLPVDYLTYMGVQNSDKEDPRRAQFLSRIEGLMKKLSTFAPVDAAVDQKARGYLHDCLPPMLTAEERASSVQGAPSRWENGEPVDMGVAIRGQIRVRLVRSGIARLCSDGEAVWLYYTADNSRVYHKEEPKSVEIKAEHTDAMEFLIHAYPKFVTVGSLPCKLAEDKVSLAELLFKRGLIHTAEPLQQS